uniref:Uncharacterized protein n=1 Tax=Chromera velia CCMP2878 TaxID=1169474 RepID=A0A0G4HL44_9ALVE|eukprot:Cvel_28647.t1-p1 / transcript=Cvel_28647.t1 / gene=Cvel_28647 / organism=Chromera_velia_CCMP2878 / gene_product=hypothetical protein / transcript_product=hypothetical protein / location=Cvel_scaffold3789:343-996(+) / protein_length=218 / sequence_SO=supercontig / SO=protein_coding / is_pseudo=false
MYAPMHWYWQDKEGQAKDSEMDCFEVLYDGGEGADLVFVQFEHPTSRSREHWNRRTFKSAADLASFTSALQEARAKTKRGRLGSVLESTCRVVLEGVFERLHRVCLLDAPPGEQERDGGKEKERDEEGKKERGEEGEKERAEEGEKERHEKGEKERVEEGEKERREEGEKERVEEGEKERVEEGEKERREEGEKERVEEGEKERGEEGEKERGEEGKR